MNGKAGSGIFGGRELFIAAAGEAVLRTEESDEFKRRRHENKTSTVLRPCESRPV